MICAAVLAVEIVIGVLMLTGWVVSMEGWEEKRPACG